MRLVGEALVHPAAGGGVDSSIAWGSSAAGRTSPGALACRGSCRSRWCDDARSREGLQRHFGAKDQLRGHLW